MWSYITAAQPGTAIFHERSEGWNVGDKIAAEQLVMLRKLEWRYTAIHFEGGIDRPFPEPIAYPGSALSIEQAVAKSWQTITVDELVPPEVRALLRGE